MKNISALLLAACAALFLPNQAAAQGLPEQIRISDDGRRLVTGGLPSEGLYDEAVVQVIELWFDQSNYWQLLTSNYQSATDLAAGMAVNGDTLPSPVGVRFKGQTSYSQTQNSQKKSFNITIDHEDPSQDVDGYQTLNLNNCFQDPSFLREVTYLNLNRRHIPAAKGSFVQLFINGESWGLYPSVQALNGDYLKEWFLTNNGTRWRALRNDATGGPGGGGGPGAIFGTGVSSLNWLGADTSEYAKKYTLKTTHKPDPWTDLVKVCDVLNNTPLAELEDSIKIYLDLDRTLWFLAQEIAFSDDDSYVHKGGMDYYLYWEPETGRLVPLEYDGNSVMDLQHANWSPFYNETDDRYALMNRLFAVPELRQRYLAHLRTVIAQSMEQTAFNGMVDAYFELADSFVQADTKKLYTYNQFVQGKQDLKNFIQQHRTYMLANSEVNAVGLAISEVEFASGGELFAVPDAGEEVTVTAQASGAAGVDEVSLYFATGFVGVFQKTEMLDDGSHGDGAAGDGVFGAVIPGFPNGTYVRHYVEAIAANGPKTASYAPAGAEHDVFIYRVGITEYVDSEVVVNELMASNTATAADQDGEFDDWIELFNNSADAVDLSGWSLTDNDGDLSKWTFPEGSILGGGGYLIVWADEDGSQAGLHASFKLSASGGETLWLVDPEQRIAQEITFGEQVTDKGFARVPNGTGDFVIQNPTFNWNNEQALAAGETEVAAGFEIFPNPAGGKVAAVRSSLGRPARLEVFSLLGQKVWETSILEAAELNVEDWQPGVFLVKIEGGVRKLVVR